MSTIGEDKRKNAQRAFFFSRLAGFFSAGVLSGCFFSDFLEFCVLAMPDLNLRLAPASSAKLSTP
ncbi:MAG: hypothetical protein H7343_11450 [Undibacterium sp.]|nr:hypothetical protein [Opitutaceae bacterium]